MKGFHYNGKNGNEICEPWMLHNMIKSLTNLQYQLGSWVKFRLDTVSKTRGSARVMVGLITASVTAAVVAIFYAQICEFAFERAIKLSEERPLLFVLLAPIFFGLSSYLVLKFSREAGGSGIPRLLHEIEKPPEHEQQSARIVRLIKLIFIKIISSVSGLLGGGIVGREGPTIQIAATIFDLLDTTFHGYFSKRVSRQSLLIAGGSAGLAAAFNTPIGGVVFAVEELSKGHVRTFKGTLILAVITAGYITQAAIGPYLFIGHPNIGAVTLRDTVTGSIMAAGIGLCGASFGLILFKLAKYLDTWRLKQRLILACACGLTAGLVCLWLGPNASGGGGALIRQLLFVNSQDQIILGPILAIWRG